MGNDRLKTILAALACAVGSTACKGDDKPAGAQEAKTSEEGKAEESKTEQADAKAAEGDAAVAAGAATCETAAKNLVELMKPEVEKQLQQVPEEQRAMAEQQMKAQLTVEAIAAQCKQQNPDQEELTCVTNAKSVQELQGCKGAPPPGGPHGGAPPMPGGAPAPGSAPAPDSDPAAEGGAAAPAPAEDGKSAAGE